MFDPLHELASSIYISIHYFLFVQSSIGGGSNQSKLASFQTKKCQGGVFSLLHSLNSQV